MEGACLCGAAKVAVTGDVMAMIVCHCTDCRRWTGSVNYGVIVKHEQVTIEGEYKTFNLRKAQVRRRLRGARGQQGNCCPLAPGEGMGSKNGTARVGTGMPVIDGAEPEKCHLT